jgi:beta-galactosidase
MPLRASELEEVHQLSMEFVTPHTKWAQPYAGGKTRVLVFINGDNSRHWAEPYGTLPRETIELKQRFDLDAAAVYWVRPSGPRAKEHWLHGEAGVERMLNLLDQPWDCYVLYQTPLERLPIEGQYKLLNGVTAGSGLVTVGTDDKLVFKEENRLKSLPEFLAQGTPLASLPFVQESTLKGLVADPETGRMEPDQGTDAEAAHRMMSAYRIMSGRGLRLADRPELGSEIGWDTQYEYWAQLVGRAVLWAGRNEPKMTLAVDVSLPACDRAELSDQKVTVEWAHPKSPPGLEIEASLRRFDGQVTPLQVKQNAAATGTLTWSVPDLRAGRYFVDVRARGTSGAQSWASTTFAVTSARRVASLELDAPYSEIGGTLSGRITLEGKPLRRERVRVDLLDSRNRIVARSDLRAAAGDVPFKFDVEPWMPMLTRVVARLLAGGREVDHQTATFHVTKRHRGRFNFIMWDCPFGTLAPWAERALAKYGVTLQLESFRVSPPGYTGNPRNYVAANEITWLPYTTSILNDLDTNGVMISISLVGDPYKMRDETGCWNDPKVIGPRMKNFATQFTPSRQHGVYAYSLGDEIDSRGSCLSPHCLRAYRKYLEQEYGSIEALNASWGSTYKGFDDIELLDPKDNEGTEARRQGIYARWYDRQAYQSYNICRYYKTFGDAYRSIDPKAWTGFEGHSSSGVFGESIDFDLIIRNIQWWAPIADVGDEVIRSLAPRDFPRWNWMGYVKKAEPLLGEYWRMVTHGCDAVGWYTWHDVERFHGFLAPWMGQFDATKELLADTAVVRNGLGTLLMKSEQLDDGIAILFSHPSDYATKVETGPSYGHYRSMHAFWIRALRELRLEFRYVSARMLRLGEFKPGSARVLILAQAEALGPKEAAAIRRFVEAGGTVIADVRPGIYTDRCKPRTGSVLADLFGIKPAEPATAKTATAMITGPFGDATLKGMLCDPSVQLAGGQAQGKAGDIPVVIVNKVGKGRAVLLNFSMAGTPDPQPLKGFGKYSKYFTHWSWMHHAPAAEACAELLGRLLASSGVEPALQVLNQSGGRFHDLEVRRWQNGRIRIISLFRYGSAGGEDEALLKLPEARHVYNLRSGRDLGRTASLSVPILPRRATFLILAPQPAPDVELKLSAQRAARGQVVRLTASVPGAAGLHAVRVQVKTPTGEIAEWLNRELMVDGRGQGCDLPVAFNDPVGRWTVEATDLYTEKITTAGYRVK